MPGLFRINLSVGAFQLLNAAGTVVADSRDKIMRVTDVLQGSVTPPFRNTPVDITATYSIGACNAASDLVFGWARCSYSGTPLDGIPATGWFAVGGSYVHVFGTGQFNSGANCSAIASYAFTASSGAVTLHERVTLAEYKNDVGQNLQYVAPEIFYEIWVATFS